MKNVSRIVLTFAVAVLTVMAPASACLAYTDDVVICRRLAGNAVIDADLGEWDTTSPIVLDSKNQLVRDASQWTGTEDLSAHVYVMWDEASLYLAARVQDDTPFMYREGFPPDLADAIVLQFGTDPNSDPNRKSYDPTDFRLTMIIDDYLFNTGLDREMVAEKRGLDTRGDGGDEQILEGYEYAVAEVDGGYVFEARIPFANFSNDRLPLLTPRNGMMIGFNISIFDLDFPCPGVATARMVWTRNAGVDTNPSTWGALTFTK